MYNPSETEWEVAKQMNADFTRIQNQRNSIDWLFSVNRSLRAKIKELEKKLEER